MNASAVTINSQLRQQDSFSQTQDEYITILSTCNPEQKPRATCEAFIKMFRAYSRGGNYDFNVLISKEKLLTDNLLYRKSEADFRRAVSEDFGLKIISDSIKLNNVKEEIRGSNALIEIQEKYEYTLENDKDEKFYRNRKYIFTLKKEKESWLIESVKTDDPWEQKDSFAYRPIDVESEVMSLKNERCQTNTCKPLNIAKKDAEIYNEVSSLYQWIYYPNVVANYAADYFDSVNPLFGSNGSNNCQNFASQCVWAGLRGSYGATATSTTTYPSVSSNIVGKNSKNVWARNDYSNYYSQSYFNWAWDNAAGFAKMIATSSMSTYGPYGNTNYGNLNYADKGTIIAINWDGTATQTTLDHAMVVTKVKSGSTLGSRNRSDLYIAANSSQSNSAYEPLLNYCGNYPEANYSTSIIQSGYYPQAQYNN